MIGTSSHSTPKASLSYFILYGFSGGQAHSRKFRRLMSGLGLKLAASALDANILVAHSAGCFMIPEKSKASLLILIGVPLNQNTIKTYLRAHANNIGNFFRNRQLLQGVRIGLNSSYYMLTHPTDSIHAARVVHAHQSILPDGKHSQVVWVMNQHDPWPKVPELTTFLDEMPYSFIGLHGSHDSIWTDPEKFVVIISLYAKRLLAQTNER